MRLEFLWEVNQPEVMIARADKAFDAGLTLIDETSKRLIRQLIHNLVEWTWRIRDTRNESQAAD